TSGGSRSHVPRSAFGPAQCRRRESPWLSAVCSEHQLHGGVVVFELSPRAFLSSPGRIPYSVELRDISENRCPGGDARALRRSSLCVRHRAGGPLERALCEHVPAGNRSV